MSRVFILTGAASGIGRHLCGVLSSLGDKVLATDVNAEALKAAAATDRWPESQVRLATLDVRSKEQWEQALAAAISTFGKVDVLLNVAGYLKPGNCWELDAAEVDRHYDINVKGVVYGTTVVSRYFVQQKAGHVVNIGSLASLHATPGLALYSSSKFAVRGFSIACAAELVEHGVAVSLVMPDAVKTPMLDLQVDYPQAAHTFSGARALTVEDVCGAITGYVLSERPLEVTLPLGRGLLARLGNSLPAVAMKVGPLMTKKGLKAQEKLKQGR